MVMIRGWSGLAAGLRTRGAGLLAALALGAAWPAPEAHAAVWRFAVIGSTRGDGTNTPSAPWVNTDALAGMAHAMCGEGVDLVLVTGDLVYGDPDAGTNWAAQYEAWSNAVAPLHAAGIPVYPVRGAHEARGDTTNGSAFQAAFRHLPRNGPAGERGLTYRLDHRNACFIGLDQHVSSHAVNQAWLDGELARQPRTHLFVFGHEPAVQVESPDCLAADRTARNEFLDRVTDSGGLVYFCGRDAFYNRAALTAPNGRTLRQLVVGTGGAPADDWSGVYGAAAGEAGLAVKGRHIGHTNGYLLVTVSNLAVTLDWKGSTNLSEWSAGDTAAVTARNPAAVRCTDYDGDRKTDPAVYDEAAAAWTALASGNGYQPLSFAIGGAGWRNAPGDYDGDGRADPAVMDKTGAWSLLLSGSGYQAYATPFGGVGDGPVPADYDGDGITDLAVYRMSDGAWSVSFSDSGYQPGAAWLGGPGWTPVPADYDGDGKADPCVYRESAGMWSVRLSGSGYLPAEAQWGGTGWTPSPADFDGDGKADPCVYFRTTGDWSALLSGSQYRWAASVTLGSAEYKPVPADFDGDGKADPAVYDAPYADWAVLPSTRRYQQESLPFGGASWLAARPAWKQDLVFLAFGDSITYGASSSSGGPATGYPALIEAQLKRLYDGYFSAINSGQPGEDTYEGLRRLERLLGYLDVDLLLLMEGTNDHHSGYPYDGIEANLRAMVRLALGRGIPVILATIPPVISNAYRDRAEQQARIVGFNPRIYGIAADFNIPVAPVFESITAVPGWEWLLMDQPSANHPNDAGYRVLRDAFFVPLAAGLEAGEY